MHATPSERERLGIEREQRPDAKDLPVGKIHMMMIVTNQYVYLILVALHASTLM